MFLGNEIGVEKQAVVRFLWKGAHGEVTISLLNLVSQRPGGVLNVSDLLEASLILTGPFDIEERGAQAEKKTWVVLFLSGFCWAKVGTLNLQANPRLQI